MPRQLLGGVSVCPALPVELGGQNFGDRQIRHARLIEQGYCSVDMLPPVVTVIGITQSGAESDGEGIAIKMAAE